MGILRISLAIFIFLGHYEIAFGDNGVMALFPYVRGSNIAGGVKVSAFFVISGFYTQLLLEEKFAHLRFGILKFYGFRIVRLFPAYYIVLALTLMLLAIFSASHIPHPGMINLNAKSLHTLAFWRNNLLAFNPAVFTIGTITTGQIIFQMVLWQAWWLALDIAFLSFSPYFMLDKKGFWALAVISVLMAIYCFVAFQQVRGTLYSTMIYFMAGAVGYKFYSCYLKGKPRKQWQTYIAYGLVALLAISLCFFGLETREIGMFQAYWAFLAVLALCLPFIAAYTDHIVLDRFIGDLTYPIYLVHQVIFYAVLPLGVSYPFLICASLCVAFALFYYFWVDAPLRVWRHKHLLS